MFRNIMGLFPFTLQTLYDGAHHIKKAFNRFRFHNAKRKKLQRKKKFNRFQVSVNYLSMARV